MRRRWALALLLFLPMSWLALPHPNAAQPKARPAAHLRSQPAAPVAASPGYDGCSPDPAGDPLSPWMLMGHFTTYYPGSAESRNYNLALAARKLCGKVVPAGGVFSFNAALGQASREQGFRMGHVFIGDRIIPGYGGGVCQVASTVYNAAQRAGLKIAERHQHGLTVPYLASGEDSTIAFGYLDLRIRNDTGEPIRLVMRAKGPRVTAEWFGSRQPPDVRYRHEALSKTPYRTIRRADPSLPPGKEVVDAPGQAGASVHTWLDRDWPDGRHESFDLGVDSYRPSPRIVRYGPRPT